MTRLPNRGAKCENRRLIGQKRRAPFLLESATTNGSHILQPSSCPTRGDWPAVTRFENAQPSMDYNHKVAFLTCQSPLRVSPFGSIEGQSSGRAGAPLVDPFAAAIRREEARLAIGER
eukprot:scaffold7066_cov253-Pinguiococcus_pyrenoidosus.AAC.10